MSKSQEPLGMRKEIRAISSDLVYQGRAIRGRQRTRVDGPNNSYDIIETPGETVDVDQGTAKEWVMSGKAELLDGGMYEVIPQADGFPIYKHWNKNASDPNPVYEKCELLQPLFLGDGCHLPVGTKIRIDVRSWERRQYFYSDETQQDEHRIRVLAASPKRVKLNAVEQAGKVNAIFDKLFPAAV